MVSKKIFRLAFLKIFFIQDKNPNGEGLDSPMGLIKLSYDFAYRKLSPYNV